MVREISLRETAIGFNPVRRLANHNGKGGLGLVGMRERATYVGGTFQIHSVRQAGTEIKVRIPLGSAAQAGVAGEVG